jgi:hypothetical protein
MEALLSAARGDGTPIQLVIGPPGLGKSRLLQEVETVLAEQGISVWRADPPSLEASPYAPIGALLRGALDAPDPASARSLLEERLGQEGFDESEAGAIAEHAATVGWSDLLPTDEPDLVHRSLLICLSLFAPPRVVWILEDLHEAAPDLLALLGKESAFRRSGRTILASARPSFVERNPFSAESAAVRHLAPVPDSSLRELLESLLGHGTLPERVVEAVVEGAGGNPLFVEETVRSWILSGRVVSNKSGWLVANAGSLDPPASMDAAYLGQLDDLPAGARRLAQVSAVLGLTFPRAAIETLDASSGEFDLLLRWGFFEGPMATGEEGHWYRHRHALLRDAAYGSLTRLERSRLHTAYADWLAAGSRGDQRESVAIHLEAAYVQAPALSRSDEMASRAAAALENAAIGQAGSAPQRAADYYRRSIGLTPAAGWEARIRRTLGVAEAERRAGRLEASMEAFDDAGRQAQTANRSETLALAAVGYEDALFASRLQRSAHGLANRRLLDAALALLPDRLAGAKATVLAAKARALLYEEGADQSIPIAESALDMARVSEDRAAEAYAWLSLRLAHAQPHQLLQRRDQTQSLMAAAVESGDRERELEGVRHLVIDHLQLGAVDESKTAALRAEELIRALRLPLFFWYPAMWRSMFALMEGDFGRADELVEKFRLEGERWGYRDTKLVHAAQLVHLAIELGTPALAQEASVEAEEISGYRWWPIAAMLARACGDLDLTQHYVSRMAADNWRVIPGDLSAPYLLAVIADLAVALGDATLAGEIAARLEPWSGQAIVLGSGALCLGAVDSYLGRVRVVRGENHRAVALLEGAARLNEAMGASPALDRTRRDLAALGT